MSDRLQPLDDCLKRMEVDIQWGRDFSPREHRFVQAIEAIRECLVDLSDRIDTLENNTDE